MAVGSVGAVTVWEAAMAASNIRWYGGLLKPIFAPSPWLAASASLGLAFTLAWALFGVLCRADYLADRAAAIRLFAVALGLDVLWSWLFFAGRHPAQPWRRRHPWPSWRL